MSQIALAAWDSTSTVGFFLDAIVKATVLLGLAALAAVILRRASAAARHCLWLCALGGLILLPAISCVAPRFEIPVLAAALDAVEARPITTDADLKNDFRPPVAVSSPAALSSLNSSLPATGPQPTAVAPAPPRPTGSFVAGPQKPMNVAATVASSDKKPAVVPRTKSAAPAMARVAWPEPTQWILIVWTIGFCGSLLPTMVGLAANAVRRRRSPRVTDAAWLALLGELRGKSAMRRAVELRRSGALPITIPITWGVVRPVILLPADADVWTEPQRRAVLLHELAHVRRFDVGSQLVGRLAAALYWFHPLAWYALGRLRAECEYAADDCLIHAGHRRSDYAEQLLVIARSARRMRMAAAVAMARGNSLEERLRVLFDDARSHRPLNRRAALGLLAALALVTAALASVRPGRAQASSPPVKVSPGPPSPPKESLSKSSPATSADTVTGTVIGSKNGTDSGVPVAGASVYLLRRPLHLFPTHRRAAKADAEGRFTFQEVPPGSYFLWAESGNRVSNLDERYGEHVEMTANAGLAPFTLRLTEACRFRVGVTAKADGRPIAKAAIRLSPDIERKFETDANGIALVEAVRPRQHSFRVGAEGFAAQVMTVAATQPGTTSELAFALEPGGQIRGTVRDAEGKPIAFVGVTLARANDWVRTRVDYLKSDVDGRFLFDNVPLSETLEISVGHENQWKKQNVLLGPDRNSLVADLTFDKRPDNGSVIVRVTGPDRRPIAGAEISNPGSSTQWLRKGTTDTKGEFRLDHVYDMLGRFELFVRAKGFAAREVNFQPGPATKPGRIDVELQRGRTIRARVMLTDGKPAANVPVFFDRGKRPDTTGGEITTDAQGRFSLDSLPPGCTFTIYSPRGYAPFTDRRLPLDGLGEVVVTLDAAGIVKGRVVDAATGKPAIPYRIRLMASHNRRRRGEPAYSTTVLGTEGRVILEPDGQFEFGDLPPGAPLYLKISAKGYVDQSLDRVIAQPDNRFKPLEVRLKKVDPRDFRTVSGRLVTAEGKPVAGAELRLWTTTDGPEDGTRVPFNWPMIQNGQLEMSPQCQQYLATTTDKEGGFTFPNVRLAGYTELDFWGSQIFRGRETVDVSENSPPVVNLRVHALATARLIVEVDRTVWPDAGQVSVYQQDRDELQPQSEPIEGQQHRVAFEGLPAGSFRVQLFDRGRDANGSRVRHTTLSQQTVTLKAGETTTVRFEKAGEKR
jgi:beta-lactamase regulating signal transducer with metallopeptidase domain/5-hydroxyisourate hydrolase-like protein (transthyretin family)